MKTISILLFLGVQQMINPILSPDLLVHSEISEDLKKEIIHSVTTTINQYNEMGSCFNKSWQQFDEDKYLGFIKLFAGSATIVDDLSFTDEVLPYSEYALKIFDNLQEIGVPFNLEEVVIKKIDIDETGFFVIDVNITKRLYSGLNKNGNPVKLKSGRKVKLNMRIDLPDYLLSDARIQYVRAQTPKSFYEFVKQPVQYFSRKLINK